MEPELYDVGFPQTTWRGNRKSSFAQLYHADERESVSEAVKMFQLNGASSGFPVKGRSPVEVFGLHAPTKSGLDLHALVELKHAFEESSCAELDKLAKEDQNGQDSAIYTQAKLSGRKTQGRTDVESDSDLSEDEDDAVREKPVQIRFKAASTTVERPANVIEKIISLDAIQTYVTATQDGLLKLWHADTLKPLRTQRNGNGAWITDIVAMAQQPLAAFAMDRSLTFYDTGRLSFDVLGRIEHLINFPLSATWVRTAEHDKLLYGDDQGYLHMYDFSDEWGGENLQISSGIEHELLPGMIKRAPWKIHSNWVTKIKYLEHSCSLLSGSMDNSLNMLDLGKQQKKWSAKEHKNGIFAIDYCRSFNFIVTCGLEHHINIWNPFTAKTMGVLHGHQSPVLDVVVNEGNNQIISVAADNVIKIWDVRTNRCIQTITEKLNDKAVDLTMICRLFYDQQRSVLLTGGSSFEAWHKKLASEIRASKNCTIVYSGTFRQVVVGEVDSSVRIWNIDNGAQIFAFADKHRGAKFSALHLDGTGRRLLIGGQDGSLRMWNFNNGQCLKEFQGFGQDEITCILCLVEGRSKYVAAAGWKGKVCIWEDGAKEQEVVEHILQGHFDDVVCMTFCPPNCLATGGYDENVIVWKLDGTIKCVLKIPQSEPRGGSSRVIMDLVQLSHVETILAGSAAHGYIYFWNISDVKLIYEHSTGHIAKLGPMCIDSKNKVLFSSDVKGYVKAWAYAQCDFKQQILAGSVMPEMFCFRAHHDSIVGMAFVDQENLLLTTSLYGTSRLWTDNGVRIGQFGQLVPWDLLAPGTWARRRPSYITHLPQDNDSNPSTRSSSRVSTSTGTSSSGTSLSRSNFICPILEKAETTMTSRLDDLDGKEGRTRRMPSAAEVLESGPPHLRLESWFTPLQAAFQRKLSIKASSSPIL